MKSYKVIKLLNGHKSQVNSVKWVANSDHLVISSSADKTAIVWDLNTYQMIYRLIGHKESIILSHSYQLSDNRLLSLTTSTDKCLKIWLNDKQIAELFVDRHEDWIRAIDVLEIKNKSLMIATSSQDSFIRVHQIERIDDRHHSDMNSLIFSAKTKDVSNDYSVRLETVLAGHEGWVTEVRWHEFSHNRFQLLSASMDKTMILWQSPEEHNLDDLWIECLRVGEIGGNTLGFLGCASSTQFNLIVGHSFNGAFHIWRCVDNEWKPDIAISGHFDAVTDISWEPKGEYLLSCSADETTRLHAIWSSRSDDKISWHEMSRPQIHGYGIKCIAMIDRHTFVSGADEKVLRLFRATKCFAQSLKHISNVDISNDMDEKDVPHSATVPTLGLSNTAVYEPQQVDHEFKPTILEVPPTEESLLQNTLWPEIHKLYGHVFELFSVASNRSGTLIASASKASKAENADIILWDVKEAKLLSRLSSHQLTVTRIRFSSDDRYILSTSRDRTWSLFQRQDNGSDYCRIGFTDKKNGIHSRIIWDCALTPDCKHFVTVSRDKSAVFWTIDLTNKCAQKSTLGPVTAIGPPLSLLDSITTVDICDITVNDNYLVAFGLENGFISFYYWNSQTFWSHLLDINDWYE
ncbi:unnamed protein product [Medioppia subpectinata]|uniref:Elongator complex protein 2 n=1 Tax=Medioppia subpectinata TaxID=1979941 RepID=A0A7R9Q2N9_9ACAR|nr:unnamed protein product [Medioppia subpectinata]CAG2109620.1 unnamed protein product [Medioppia subpectinata]